MFLPSHCQVSPQLLHTKCDFVAVIYILALHDVPQYTFTAINHNSVHVAVQNMHVGGCNMNVAMLYVPETLHKCLQTTS